MSQDVIVDRLSLRRLLRCKLGQPAGHFPMPRPISLNNAFATFNGRRIKSRAYDAWRGEASAMMMASGPRRQIDGPLVVLCELGTQKVSPQIDTDNCGKAMLDVAVTMGVIPDDNRRVITHLAYEWRDFEGSALWVWEAKV